ncbi:MAG: hypothetical protein LUC88_09485 [Prevotella sp.]|nr:hypothetical protein [Prevotella sp.]
MKKLLTLCTLLCLCLFANAATYTNQELGTLTLDEDVSYTGDTYHKYIYTYTPEASGTLSITTDDGLDAYSDAGLSSYMNPLNTDRDDNGVEIYNYSLTAGNTYYFTFTTMLITTSFSYTATFVSDSDIPDSGITLELVKPTAEDGLKTDEAGKKTMTLGSLQDLEIIVRPSEYKGVTYETVTGQDDDGNDVTYEIPISNGYKMAITIGEGEDLRGENYNVDFNDTDSCFEWTVEVDEDDADIFYQLYSDTEYPVIATMTEDNTVLVKDTLFTITGTYDRPVYSEYDVKSIDPDPESSETTDIEWTSGKDAEIAVTFTGKVKITEVTRSLGQGVVQDLTNDPKATGADTEDGYSTEWTITVSSDELSAGYDESSSEGDIIIGFYAEDADGYKLNEGLEYTYSFYYKLVEGQEEEDTEINPGINLLTEINDTTYAITATPAEASAYAEAVGEDAGYSISGESWYFEAKANIVLFESDTLKIKTAADYCYIANSGNHITDIQSRNSSYTGYLNLASTLSNTFSEEDIAEGKDPTDYSGTWEGMYNVKVNLGGTLGLYVYVGSNSRNIGIWDVAEGKWTKIVNIDGANGTTSGYVSCDVTSGSEYLLVAGSTNTNIAEINFIPTGYTSGIKGITNIATATDNKIYSIDGRFLGTNKDNLSKGLYIMNGKKILVK